MDRNLQINYPYMHGCTLADPFVDDGTFVQEMIFSYRCSAECERCHMLVRNKNAMKPETAIRIADDSVAYAVSSGFKRIIFSLIGGEAFEALDRLEEFYHMLIERKYRIPILFRIVTCGKSVSDEAYKWLDEHPEISLALRWDSSTKETVWNHSPESFRRAVDVIYLTITQSEIYQIKDNLLACAKLNIPIVPDYSMLNRLNKADLEQYLIQMYICAGLSKPLYRHLFLTNFHTCGDRNSRGIRCANFNGKMYQCRFLAPGYQLSRIYSTDPSDIMPKECENCSAKSSCLLCPAAAASVNNLYCEMLRTVLISTKKCLPND